MLRALTFAPGLLIITWAISSPVLRRPDGSLYPVAWTLVIGGLSICLFSAARQTCMARSATLLAVALLGHACALGMIDVPSYGVLQHFTPWSELLTTAKGLFLLGPIGQILLILVALHRGWISPRMWPRSLLSLPQILLLVILFVFTGAYASWDLAKFAGEIILSGVVLIVNALNLMLVVLALPGNVLTNAAKWLQHRFLCPTRKWLFASGTALWVTLISSLLAWTVFDRVPHVADSVGYLFQAKYFASGALFLPPPPDAAAFEVEKVVNDGSRWWNYGFPGWPAVLALGVVAGAPWIVNPLLAGLTVVLAYALLCSLYNRPLALCVISLLGFSPWFLFMSASFLPHPVSVVWGLLTLIALVKTVESRRTVWGTVGGASLGALFLTRPLEALLLVPAIGSWALRWGGHIVTRSCFVSWMLSGAAVGGLIFPYNAALTGDLFRTPHQAWSEAKPEAGVDRLGFGSDIGNIAWSHLDPFPGHGLLDVIINAHQNFFNSNFELFGWSFGSLIFASIFVLWRSWGRADRLFLSIVFMVIVGHSFYWFSGGPDFGARYWYQTLVPLVVLTVRGVQELQRRWFEISAAPSSKHRISAIVVVAAVVAFVNVVPWRSIGKYHRYRGMSADVARLARDHDFGHSLVFVQARHPEDYASAFIFNPSNLDAPGTIYALDAGESSRDILYRHYPDRSVWLLGGSPSDEVRLRVLAGPLPPPRSVAERSE
jgi:hypothetical protein